MNLNTKVREMALMDICFLCGRRIWPWQKKYGKFHLECYLKYHNILFSFEEDDEYAAESKKNG